VLYVHGYRVTFDEISVQMGSFAHYLGHGAMATFQWPTGLNVWNYITDCPRADVRLQVIDVSDVRGAHEMGGMQGLVTGTPTTGSPPTSSCRYVIPCRPRGAASSRSRTRGRSGSFLNSIPGAWPTGYSRRSPICAVRRDNAGHILTERMLRSSARGTYLVDLGAGLSSVTASASA
jgi:hypothetical protein